MYGYYLEGSAELEGTVRYRHQGGGQEHTGQLRVIYKRELNFHIQLIIVQLPLHRVRLLTIERIRAKKSDSPEKKKKIFKLKKRIG